MGREDRQCRCRLALPVARRVLCQDDPLRLVEREVVLGGDIRRVRAKEPDAQEERLVLMLAEQSAGLGGDLPIGLLLIGALSG